MQKIQSSLCFKNQAEEAVQFYTSIFKNSQINHTAYYGEEISKKLNLKPKTVLSIDFKIAGQEFVAINGPDYPFTPGISFSIYPQSEEEFNLLWEKLSSGGSVLMAADKYPWSERYGWCADKFGVTWQLMLEREQPHDMTPSFLFVNNLFKRGEEAINFYTSVFPNSKIGMVHKDPEKGTVMYSDFTLLGKRFALMEDGSVEHKFTITPAISMAVMCKDQAEVDYYWEKLQADGGRAVACGWLEDKFGVSWQVVPEIMGVMRNDPDQKKVDKVMNALMTMTKLDVEKLKAAFES